MTNSKELVERRKHRRFEIKNATFALLLPEYRKMRSIIDISGNGFAFQYTDNDAHLKKNVETYILFASNGFFIDEVKAEVISDFEISNDPVPKRRCGLRFVNINHDQISQLMKFIRNDSIDEA